MIKKLVIILLIFVIVGGIGTLFHLLKVAYSNKKELKNFNQGMPYTGNLGKVLVVYYSLTGHTQEIVNQIALLTGADVYRLETKTPFEQNTSFYMQIKKDLKNKTYPQLVENTPDINNYDVIFVGGPVWWYTMATPLYSFLNQTDFLGKVVVPFSTQGSNPGTFLNDFIQHAKNAKIGTYEKFNNVNISYNKAVQNKVIYWLNNLRN